MNENNVLIRLRCVHTIHLKRLIVLTYLFGVAEPEWRTFAAESVALKTIAFTGFDAPNAPGTQSPFTGLVTPIMNSAGQIAFGGTVNSSEQGLWMGLPSGITLCASDGFPAPTLASLTLAGGASNPHGLDNSGRAYYQAILTGPGVNADRNQAQVTVDQSGVGIPALEGEVVPGIPPRIDIGPPLYRQFGAMTVNGSGWFVFPSSVDRAPMDALNPAEDRNDSSDSRINAGDPSLFGNTPTGPIAPRVSNGAPVPQVPGARLTLSSAFGRFNVPSLNGKGTLAFAGEIIAHPSLGIVDPSNDTGLFYAHVNSGPQLFAREGSPAPGANADFDHFRFAGIPRLNDRGEIVFWAALRGGNVTEHNNTSLWFGEPSSVNLLIREGDPAPGMAGATTGEIPMNSAVVGGDGTVVFSSSVRLPDGSTAEALWRGRPGHLVLIARSGQTAPGTTEEFGAFGNILIKTRGLIAFKAGLRISGESLWQCDASGSLTLIARAGHTVMLAEGVSRAFRFFNLPSSSGGEDGFPTALSDDDQLVFLATFAGQGLQAVMQADLGGLRILSIGRVAEGIRIEWNELSRTEVSGPARHRSGEACGLH